MRWEGAAERDDRERAIKIERERKRDIIKAIVMTEGRKEKL